MRMSQSASELLQACGVGGQTCLNTMHETIYKKSSNVDLLQSVNGFTVIVTKKEKPESMPPQSGG